MSKSNSELEDLIQRYNQELLNYHQRNRVRVPLTPQEIPARENESPILAEEEPVQAVQAVSAPAEEEVIDVWEVAAPAEEPYTEPESDETGSATMDIVSPQQEPSEQLPLSMENEPPATDTGYLVIRAFTARQAVPVAGAHVSVSRQTDSGEELYKLAVTDIDGRTPVMALPAASRELSQKPGNEHPYISYIVRVNQPGYIPVRDFRVPVYGGVTAIQPVELIPLPEQNNGQQGDAGSIDIVESGPQEL